jgi:cytochrome P450
MGPQGEAAQCPFAAGARPSDFSLRDPAVVASPWAFYEALHAHGGIHQDAQTGIWIVAGYHQIQQILRDNDRFSSVVDRPTLRPGGMPPEAVAILATTTKVIPTLVGADPPIHSRLRPLVNMIFNADRVERLEPFIEATVNRLIDAFAHEGGCDLVQAFAAPLPLTVIADQLGLPHSEIGKIKAWSDAMIEILGLMGDDARLVECAKRQKEALEYLLGEVRRRREDPTGSILSDLANTRDEDGAYLTDPEIASILMQLMVAGNETTTNTISAGMLYLACDAALQERLRRGDAKDMRIFVEEILRAEAPVQGHYRKAKVDVTIGDVTIPAGGVVHVRYGAGNRDESFFPNAAAIDLARSNAPQHLSFGGGIHFCVGAMLARKELQVAFRRLLDRLDTITLGCAPEALMRVPSAQHRGLIALPLLFAART